MAIVDTYPLLTVSRPHESADFVARCFGMRRLFEASWIAVMTTDDQSIAVAFMSSDHPSQPPGPELFGGGMIFTVQVDDVATLYERLSARGEPIHHALTDCAWGQRRFMLRDPSGVLIDVVEQIEPEPGFWDGYQH
jgi:uncharacterized glyoxalase superfamily protein PhnB